MAKIYSIKKLNCSIRESIILKDVSFGVEAGEYVAVIGPNGAGKTTLIRHMNRIIKSPANTVFLKQKPIETYTQKKIASIVSYVPQSPTHIQHFTVREFVLMGRYPYLGPFASPTAEDDRAVMESLDITGVSLFADRDMVTLSGGELQKVYIAAGLAQGGEVILLDEPATFLDPRHQHEIFTILQNINQQGKTVISVTHDINTAVLTASRVLAFNQGQIVFDGNAQDVMENDVLESIYGRTFSFTMHPETGNRIAIPEVYLNTEAGSGEQANAERGTRNAEEKRKEQG
ncbi:ABC transporter ATP-binding protein [Planctomycetota bacterium]